MTEQMKNQITALVEDAKIAYVSSIDETGYPNVKAMLSMNAAILKKFKNLCVFLW